MRLPYTEFTVGGKTYMLRLPALSAARFEERTGMSVYGAVGGCDKVSNAAELLYSLIESVKPEFTKQDTFALIDEYIAEGGTLLSLNEVIAKALGNSGFFAEASPAPAN